MSMDCYYRLQHIQKSLTEVEDTKRGTDNRLNSAQTALMLQEETIRRNERDIKYLNDKIGELERQLTAVSSHKIIDDTTGCHSCFDKYKL